MKVETMIAYATKKGTAKMVADRFAEILHFPVCSISDIKPSDLQQYKNLILIISNYGKGEGPKTCKDFFEDFEKIENPEFYKGVQYAVFGCGSSKRAPYYLAFTKHVENKMAELGATKIHTLGELDDKNPDKSSIETWLLQLRFE
ncbi:flavodoxin family protein [Trichomonas vaginalis G3]|uniref:Flavodoxin family protein n=1 Tax=Trichomonas vaginalis (strain ATCC PRA-98 / G3) TaxID=412133 RepID=A2FUG2_TRIV3|nr:pyruvate-flavodoxin oxidoreductase family [Trichomonas vaginalis G3]EAX91457.1 flavodoxin family protein [Trichomonas vaginalis G3]KAI5510556.1 pyruvate-flavodoxin oxidoreductase family [Trichomonas vaginalis G3]|eukprot:XP_001304387.1 flavodoxin family protein [Trichomonas vaginalis G3]